MEYSKMEELKCSDCKQMLPVECFSLDASHKRGRSYTCRDCNSKRSKIYRENNPALIKELRQRYGEANRLRLAEKQRIYAQQNPDIIKDYRLRKDFSISLETYKDMLTKQKGVCAICFKPPGEKMLAVDHDRNCCKGRNSCGGCVRGLLCHRCNTGIGFFDDHLPRIEELLNYLKGRAL